MARTALSRAGVREKCRSRRSAVTTPGRGEGRLLVGLVLAALILSGIAPRDRLTWWLEIAWVLAGLPLVLLCWRWFPLTRLLSWLLAGHALVLIYGGAYTYAETPLGDWLRDVMDLTRNPYDRIGHFVQGFVPVLLAREILIRRTPLRPGGVLGFLCVSVALSFSAFFELIEWWSAVLLGADADAFLATQGDIWDTQWDMFMCLCGAIVSLLVWSRRHDRHLGLAGRRPA